MRTTTTGYLPGNGLEMYYEIHGEGQPLVLLHGAFVAIGTSFGEFLPGLAEGRKVVAFELQGHGHTADIDRPLRYETMAERHRCDRRAWTRPGRSLRLQHGRVRRVAGDPPLSWTDGRAGENDARHDARLAVARRVRAHAPRPDDFPTLFAKKTEMDQAFHDRRDEDIRAIEAPTLVIIGDSDPVRPEHAVEMFRLLGGGVFGGMPPGMPASQLAVLPGTSHVSIASRADLVVPIVTRFLDMP